MSPRTSGSVANLSGLRANTPIITLRPSSTTNLEPTYFLMKSFSVICHVASTPASKTSSTVLARVHRFSAGASSTLRRCAGGAVESPLSGPALACRSPRGTSVAGLSAARSLVRFGGIRLLD
ncbi:uncharacterized protein Tco025E_01826 [Trypanosoma conorhini]|uniref:Uncharacterized protein n=1 Tax=Trypanosoma conorhini TaxID=83891 RepID=A0A422Q7M0_9TRYP|nr:uncharacterized protein Tco025E_01826 [Trypanosoma conorhini]RNF25958.1 hypothetical protein Tco025E_01826 [Trypanosoma conorhini]